MSYLLFLLIFLVPPLGLLLYALRGAVDWLSWRILTAIALAALIYTGPWDNAIILNGVWSFSSTHVLNVVIGVVPLEEYLFYVLQVAVTGLCTIWLLRHFRAER